MFTKTSASKSASIKAKELAERIMEKANDKSAKFPNSKATIICPSCLGTGTRYVYRYGKRLAKRCEAAVWNNEKKRFICEGNPESEEIEKANKKDLLSQIWKIVTFLKQKQAFLLWLQQEYKTEKTSSLSLQQLELILNKVKSQSIFSLQLTTKAA